MTRFLRVARLACVPLMLTLAGGAVAQSFPSRTMSLMVPYPAGGLSDVIARTVAPQLSKGVGQSVIVENLAGAGGSVAAQKVLNTAADGHVLYQGSPNELILTPMVLSSVKYKSEDWRMVQMIGAFPMAVLARKGLAANTIDELVELARKQAAAGKPLSYGSVGIGSFYHVVGAHFAHLIGAEMTHIPYKGGAPMFQDMGGENVDLAFFVVGESTLALADQGRLKVLATMAPSGKVEAEFLRRFPAVNDSKSVKDFAFNTWTGFFVRKDTPEPVVQALNKSLASAMSDPGIKASLQKIGGDVPAMMSLDEARREYEAQTARFRAIARSIKLEAQ
jgi:tripartite-type tricarboxylate transporter receptor subunit TctC